MEIKRNDKIKVIKGRKYPIGTEGRVFWIAIKPDGYGVLKIGVITTADEKIYINSDNVEVVEAAPVNPYEKKPVFGVNGEQILANDGAQNQDGSLPMFTCGKCQHPLVHCTSKRTGKKYWAECGLGRSGRHFYIKAALHNQEICDRRFAEREEWVAAYKARENQ